MLGQDIQPYNYPINTNSGLTSNTVYSLLQTKQGAIYIGHENGVTRYNGKHFYSYPFIGKGKAISNLVEAVDGTIWCRTFYGDVIKLEKDSAYLHAYSDSTKNTIPTIWLANNEIYVHDKNKIYKAGNKQLIKTAFNLTSLDWIQSICQINKKRFSLLYGHENKISVLEVEGNKVVGKINSSHNAQGRNLIFMFNNKLNIFSMSDGSLLRCFNNKIIDAEIDIKPLLLNVKLNGIVNIGDSLLGVLSFNGFYIFNNKGKLIKHLLEGSQISDVLLDKEGNIWLATLQEGIFIFPSLFIDDINLENVFDKKENISSSYKINDSTFLIGTFAGKIIKMDTKGTVLKSLKLPVKTEIQSFCYDVKKDLMYAFADGIYAIKDFKIITYFKMSSTKDLHVKDNIIYCATSNGFISLDTKLENTNLHSNSWVNQLAIQSDSVIFLATRNGLYQYNIKQKAYSPVKIPLKGFETAAIRSVQLFKNKKLYILAINKGIICRDESGKFSIVSTQKDALKIKIVGDTLLSISPQGIQFIDLNTNKVVYELNTSKAFPVNGCFDFNKFGNSYILFSNKIIRIYNKLLPKNATVPQLKINSLNGTFILNKDKLTSSYKKNSLSFLVEVFPNIRSQGKLKLKYKLVGIDEGYNSKQDALSTYEFNYKLLPPGEYIFEAYAINEDGIESKKIIIKFIVLNPFYKTWWFILIEISGGFALLFFSYKWRIAVLRKMELKKLENEQKKIRLLSAELTALRSQMNPHFIFNSLSSIQAKVLSEDKKGAYKDISTFSKLIRSVLNYSSKEFIILKHEIEFLKDYLYLESVRVDDKINYEINIDKNLDINFLEIPTLITQPFVENSIKHGLLHKDGAKNLKITFSKVGTELTISIKDNGVGFQKSKEINQKINAAHQSFATLALKNRIDRLNEGNKIKINIETIDSLVGAEIIIKINYL